MIISAGTLECHCLHLSLLLLLQENGATLGSSLDGGNVKRIVIPLEVSDKVAPEMNVVSARMVPYVKVGFLLSSTINAEFCLLGYLSSVLRSLLQPSHHANSLRLGTAKCQEERSVTAVTPFSR